MHETEYAYAVARIRSNETSLMTPADIEQLIACSGYAAALRILADKGWNVPEGSQSFDIPEKELEKAWKLICECAPDVELLEALVIGNDFSNLKAAVKATISGLDADDYYTYPCVASTDDSSEAVTTRSFEMLPEYLRDCAETAFDCVARLESGQLAEVAIDKASFETRLKYAERSQSGLLIRITRLACAAANIKIALRSAAMGKSEDFALDAMCRCDGLDLKELLDAAFAHKPLAEVLRNTDFEVFAESADKGFTELEKKLDNTVVSLLDSAKFMTFGPDPLVAYYVAKQTEAKNVRIILSAKLANLPAQAIHERVREIYV